MFTGMGCRGRVCLKGEITGGGHVYRKGCLFYRKGARREGKNVYGLQVRFRNSDCSYAYQILSERSIQIYVTIHIASNVLGEGGTMEYQKYR